MTKRCVAVDIETLGLRYGAIVISIGAVQFSPEGLGEELYEFPSRAEQEAYGLVSDQETVDWWAKQGEEARLVFSQPTIAVGEALTALDLFIGSDTLVWCNGANFDPVLLSGVYHAFKRKPRWPFWNERCHRTLVKLRPDISRIAPRIAHNALSDAKAQAEHARLVLTAMNAWDTLDA